MNLLSVTKKQKFATEMKLTAHSHRCLVCQKNFVYGYGAD